MMESKLPPIEEIERQANQNSQSSHRSGIKPLDELLNAYRGSVQPSPTPPISATPSKMNESEYYGTGIFNDIINLRNRADVRERVFEYAKNLQYYSESQKHTQFWLDVNNTDYPQFTEDPVGKDYASLHPAHKKIVLAGLARIVEDSIRCENEKAAYEKYLAGKKKEEIEFAEGGVIVGILAVILGVALGIGALIYQPESKEGKLTKSLLYVVSGVLMSGGPIFSMYNQAEVKKLKKQL